MISSVFGLTAEYPATPKHTSEFITCNERLTRLPWHEKFIFTWKSNLILASDQLKGWCECKTIPSDDLAELKKRSRKHEACILACGLRVVWERLLWSFFRWVALRFREITHGKKHLCHDKPSRSFDIISQGGPLLKSKSLASVYYHKGSARRGRKNFDNLKKRWKLTPRNVYKVKNADYR